ncbi:hypothetical protein F2P81_023683 [Scophthalmus maximus]|uniref:Uncharacterized protein n=1 Tax=Scophthalmus maximus TaxID=52904 RepID=A0A6A4RMG5_SCOMX|nr:hypothetical protein F2P81_023683 [Scophthalmus maximus]
MQEIVVWIDGAEKRVAKATPYDKEVRPSDRASRSGSKGSSRPSSSASSARRKAELESTTADEEWRTMPLTFRTLAAERGWNQAALLDAFLYRLSSDLKDQLAALDLPRDLNALIALAIKIDKQLFERERERDSTPRVPRGIIRERTSRRVGTELCSSACAVGGHSSGWPAALAGVGRDLCQDLLPVQIRREFWRYYSSVDSGEGSAFPLLYVAGSHLCPFLLINLPLKYQRREWESLSLCEPVAIVYELSALYEPVAAVGAACMPVYSD